MLVGVVTAAAFLTIAPSASADDEPVVSSPQETSGTDELAPEPQPTEPPPSEPPPATPSRLSVSLAAVPVSERPFRLAVSGQDPNVTLPDGSTVVVTWTDRSTGKKRTADATVAGGIADVRITLWRSTPVTIAMPGFEAVETTIGVRPARSPATDPHGAPTLPERFRFDDDPAAVGTGANPVTTPISEKQAASMRGLSWHPGCIPLSSLRELRVNYWGRDGYRHRGLLVVNAAIATDAARAFTALYHLGYRIQSMHPVDRYGRNPRGPGADDYDSMAAGNTSGFNCRYVVGKERLHTASPHSSGRAIDINPWWNPYIARGGVYPNTWWLSTHGGARMQFRANVSALRALTRYGFRWGGSYGDYHHFQH